MDHFFKTGLFVLAVLQHWGTTHAVVDGTTPSTSNIFNDSKYYDETISSQEGNFNTSIGLVKWVADEYVRIDCFDDTNSLKNVTVPTPKLFNSTVHVKIVQLNGCSLPSKSYASTLTRLNINVSEVEKLELHQTSDEMISVVHMENLKISFLNVSYTPKFKPYIDVAPDFLKPLTALLTLHIKSMGLQAMPKTIGLHSAKLVEGKSTGPFGECSELRYLNLKSWDVREVPDFWLGNCTKLEGLRLIKMVDMTPKNLERVLKGITSLISLTVRHCNLGEIKEDQMLLNLAGTLVRLDFSYNKLRYFTISELPSLTDLDLSNNELTSIVMVTALDKVRGLKHLWLNDNPSLDLCDGRFNTWHIEHSDGYDAIKMKIKEILPTPVPVPPLRLLERLFAVSTATSGLCFETLESLKLLELRKSNVFTLQFKGLPIKTTPGLQILLEDNDVNEVILDRTDIDILDQVYEDINQTKDKHKRPNSVLMISGIKQKMNCRCNNGWLWRALRKNLLSLTPELKCENDVILINLMSNQLECDIIDCGETCHCRRDWYDHRVNATCQDLVEIPKIVGLSHLIAADNEIETITADRLPNTLRALDISGNKLRRMDEDAVLAMFASPDLRLWIASNPIICDCDNGHLIQALQKHYTRVQDYTNVACVDGTYISQVSVYDICTTQRQVRMTTAMAAVGGLISLAAIIVALFYRYQQQLRVFLYSNGLRYCCLDTEELDEDWPFDAFISFSHEDIAFVSEQLLPGLEKEPYAFKVCIHYRDWVAGEWIPAQITRSVEQSRRTIIVLSTNYLNSSWGMLEFRTAHLNTVRDGRPRIIVVLLDDVTNDQRLDAELRGYLRTNTYVRYDDPWFWKKLRFAMPHRRRHRSVTDLEEMQNTMTTTHENMIELGPV